MPEDNALVVLPVLRGAKAVRCKPIDRQQLFWRTVDVEKLVGAEHRVRAIWAFVEHLDLSAFYAPIEAFEGGAGRPVWDPRVLLCLWLEAYRGGVNSAREIAELCQYHPAYQWLTGMAVVNYHTLADFRVAHRQALDELFVQTLGVLSHQGLITLERVMHDGTKIKASASDQSFHRQATLESHLEAARQQVQAMGDPHSEELSARVAQARKRALREKQQRLEQALQEFKQLKQTPPKEDEATQNAESEKRKEPRLSSTDPQARVMKGAKGAFGPAYNVQISTDAKAKIIVAMDLTQSSSDAGELAPAVEQIEENLGQKPKQMVVDAAYPTQAAIEAMAQQGIDLIGPLRPSDNNNNLDSLKRRGISPEFYPEAFSYDEACDSYSCPAKQLLRCEGQEKKAGWINKRYRARASVCRDCPFQAQCCPKTKKGRSLVRRQKSETLLAHEAKMNTPEAKTIYKQRAGVAETPNAWIKEKFGLRQFRLRGRIKVRTEALWACLTYNICQWARQCWQPHSAAVA
jgi:transposase